MRMIIIILCSISTSLFINVSLSGQNSVMVLKNKSSGKEKVFHEGEQLKVVCNNGIVNKGSLRLNDTTSVISENHIIIGSNEIKINDINKIKSSPFIKNFLGSSFIGLGGYTLVGGINFLYGLSNLSNPVIIILFGNLPEEVAIAEIMGGGILFAIGVVLLVNRSNSYSIENWELTVK